jgi:hypothetical protein
MTISDLHKILFNYPVRGTISITSCKRSAARGVKCHTPTRNSVGVQPSSGLLGERVPHPPHCATLVRGYRNLTPSGVAGGHKIEALDWAPEYAEIPDYDDGRI